MFRNDSANKVSNFFADVMRGIFFPVYLILIFAKSIGKGLRDRDPDYIVPCTIVTVFVGAISAIVFFISWASSNDIKTKEVWIPIGTFQAEDPIFVDKPNANDYYFIEVEGYGKFKVRNNSFVNASFTKGTKAYVMREYWINDDNPEKEFVGNTYMCQEGGECFYIEDVDFAPETYASIKKMEIKTDVPK